MSMSRRRIVSWSELPPELLTLIADKLGTQTDMCHFRSVCKQWRTSTYFLTNVPKNILSPILPFKFSMSDNNFILVPCSIYLARSSVNSTLLPWLFTVEELNPGTLYLRRPFTSSQVINLDRYVPKNFKLSYFHVKEVGRFHIRRYSNNVDDILKGYGRNGNKNKAVLVVDSKCKTFPRLDDCIAVVLSDDGTLQLIVIKHRRVEKITCSIKLYDDVVNYKGNLFAVDRRGRGYTMGYNERKLNIVAQSVGEGCGSDRKKRLVVSSNGELYLVHGCPSYINKGQFKLYKFNDEKNVWDEVVEGIGVDRIIVMTCDGCFFVMTKDFPWWKGNCIVFHRGLFPSYNNGLGADMEIFGRWKGNPSEFDFAMFNIQDRDYKLVDFSLFWPPPAWLMSDTNWFNSVSMAEARILRDFYNRVISEPKPSEVAEVSTVAKSMVDMKHKQGHDLIPNVTGRPIIIDIDSFPDIKTQAAENAVLQGTFQGVSVSSNLIPILEKIWEKYGNVIQDKVVSSNSLLTWALESIAKTVIILQSNTCESLSDCQTAFLRATLKDLQHLHIRLDWLGPFVYKVLAPRNSN